VITDHIVNAIGNHQLVTDSTLHVVAVISNPARYHSRYRIFRQWAEHMRATANVQLHVAELAFGDRHHEVTGAADLQLRSSYELWHKENLINLAVRHLLPRDWKYVAWIDADVWFQQPNWAVETVHLLQHYPVVQPWTECVDMGPHGGALAMHRSFCGLVQKRVRMQRHKGEPYAYGHSGFAWACTREFWEAARGLMDFAILGSADHHMAWAMINDVASSVHGGMSDSFKRRCREWQSAAFGRTHGNLAAVSGVLQHAWHGSKTNRFYRERWQVLVDHKYDPDTDLGYDAQGLVYVRNKPGLEEDIRRYMRSRQEDGIEE
jgi:hypothetical protein